METAGDGRRWQAAADSRRWRPERQCGRNGQQATRGESLDGSGGRCEATQRQAMQRQETAGDGRRRKATETTAGDARHAKAAVGHSRTRRATAGEATRREATQRWVYISRPHLYMGRKITYTVSFEIASLSIIKRALHLSVYISIIQIIENGNASFSNKKKYISNFESEWDMSGKVSTILTPTRYGDIFWATVPWTMYPSRLPCSRKVIVVQWTYTAVYVPCATIAILEHGRMISTVEYHANN